MIAKANTHNSGVKLAAYLMRDESGQTATLHELRGFATLDIKDAFRDIDIMCDGTRCEQPFFHLQIRLKEGERLGQERWEAAADKVEQTIGFEGQARAIVFHTNDHTGDTHMHVAWSRIDGETLKAKPVPFFKLALKEVSRNLEQEWGLSNVRNEREDPIKYAPTKSQDEQARRLGTDIHEIRNAIRSCWTKSTSGKEFDDALAEHNLILARGDEAPFVVIDRAGGIHSIGQRILDIPAARIRQQMSDIDRENLVNVEDARAKILGLPTRMERMEKELGELDQTLSSAFRGLFNAVNEREEQGHVIEPEPVKPMTVPAPPRPGPELAKTAGQIRLAYSLTETGQEFADALEDRGLILAQITKEDAERLNRWERQRIREIWEKEAEPTEWMAQKDKELNPVQLDAAHRSYEKYLAKNQDEQEKRKPLGFAAYVAFVQSVYDPMDKTSAAYQRYKEGELVVVDAFSGIHQLTFNNTGDRFEHREEHLKDVDRAPLLSASAADSVMKRLSAHRYAEWQQEQAGKKEPPKPETRAAEIRAMYQASASGQQFEDAIERKGYTLARVSDADATRLNRWESQRLREEAVLRGEHFDTTRPTERYKAGELVVIDAWANIYQLNERSTGDSEKWREQRLSDVDRNNLMNVAPAQSAMRMVAQHQREEREQVWQQERRQSINESHWPAGAPTLRPLTFREAAQSAGHDARTDQRGMAGKVFELRSEITQDDIARAIETGQPVFVSPNNEAFAERLDEHGIKFAVASKDEAERSHREAEFARTLGNYAPRFKEGEIVIVTEPGLVFRHDGVPVSSRRVHKLDQTLGDKYVTAIGQKGKLQGIDATLAKSDDRAMMRDVKWEKVIEFAHDGRNRRNLIDYADRTIKPANVKGGAKRGAAIATKATSKALDVAAGAMEIVGSLIEGLFGGVQTPQMKREAEAALNDRAEQAKDDIDLHRHETIVLQHRHIEREGRER